MREFLELVKEDLAKEGVELVVEVFNDYIQPNKLVASGELMQTFSNMSHIWKNLLRQIT